MTLGRHLPLNDESNMKMQAIQSHFVMSSSWQHLHSDRPKIHLFSKPEITAKAVGLTTKTNAYRSACVEAAVALAAGGSKIVKLLAPYNEPVCVCMCCFGVMWPCLICLCCLNHLLLFFYTYIPQIVIYRHHTVSICPLLSLTLSFHLQWVK